MRAKSDEKAASAGISVADDEDVTAVYERLREELSGGRGDGASTAETRALAERFWPVTAERPVGTGAKAFAKRVLRKLMRWYVEPLAADQRMFNDAVLKLLDASSARAGEARAAGERAEQLLRELEERLTRVERSRRAAGVDGAPAAPIT